MMKRRKGNAESQGDGQRLVVWISEEEGGDISGVDELCVMSGPGPERERRDTPQISMLWVRTASESVFLC
jgi:hypothetical protein